MAKAGATRRGLVRLTDVWALAASELGVDNEDELLAIEASWSALVEFAQAAGYRLLGELGLSVLLDFSESPLTDEERWAFNTLDRAPSDLTAQRRRQRVRKVIGVLMPPIRRRRAPSGPTSKGRRQTPWETREENRP